MIDHAYETVFKSFSKKAQKEILERGEWYEDFVWYTREDLELGLLQQDKQVYDTHGDRWVRCSKCGKADRTDAFFEYGGQDTKNIGICSECQRKSREKR